jgi:hypothetical protein
VEKLVGRGWPWFQKGLTGRRGGVRWRSLAGEELVREELIGKENVGE